jgi:hypothetical protein
MANLKLVDLTNRTVRLVAPFCGSARYSPDGSKFACVTNGVVSVMNVDGTGQRLLTAASYDDVSGVDWSADGEWLIATNRSTGPNLIKVSDATAFAMAALVGYSQVSFIR